MKRNNRITLLLAISFTALFSLGGCSGEAEVSAPEEQAETTDSGQEGEVIQYDRSDVAMGTVVSETIYTSGEDLTAQVMELLGEVEREYISWRKEESDIAAVNQNAGNEEGTWVDEDTALYLRQSLQLAETSGGAFDPTVGEITQLWDIDGENPKVPDEEELKTLLTHVGYEKVRLEDNRVILEQDTSIDLGAVGKGIGCDEVAQLLKGDQNLKGAVVSVGGSILVLGTKPDQSPWKVAVTDPRDDTAYLGVLTLSGEHYISTSGDYEKYFIQDGVRYHHIMDPATGYPSRSGLISVTVLGDNGLDCDGLSTACFVLGLEKGMQLLEAYGAEGVFVDEEQNVYLTDGMEEYFTLTGEGYQVQETSQNR